MSRAAAEDDSLTGAREARAPLVLAANPSLTVGELRARLLESVDKIPALEGRVASGGRLNAARAVGAR